MLHDELSKSTILEKVCSRCPGPDSHQNFISRADKRKPICGIGGSSTSRLCHLGDTDYTMCKLRLGDIRNCDIDEFVAAFVGEIIDCPFANLLDARIGFVPPVTVDTNDLFLILGWWHRECKTALNVAVRVGL